MKLHTTILAAFAGLAIACGAGAKDETTTPKTEPVHKEGHGDAKDHDKGHDHKGHEGDAKKHDHAFTPEMKTFHDGLSPLWHAKPSDKRVADTCAATATFVTQAKAIAAATAPEGAKDGWAAATKGLVDAANQFVNTCKGDKATFAKDFTAVHQAFHAVMANMPKKAGMKDGDHKMKHDDHGKKHDHGHKH